jgi:hypothetical protein
MSMAQTAGATSSDKLVFYASIFLYMPKLKQEYGPYNPSIMSYERKLYLNGNIMIESNMLPQGSSAKFQEFMGMNDEQQRQTIQDVRI